MRIKIILIYDTTKCLIPVAGYFYFACNINLISSDFYWTTILFILNPNQDIFVSLTPYQNLNFLMVNFLILEYPK